MSLNVNQSGRTVQRGAEGTKFSSLDMSESSGQRIARLREEIRSGRYETTERLCLAVDWMVRAVAKELRIASPRDALRRVRAAGVRESREEWLGRQNHVVRRAVQTPHAMVERSAARSR